MQLNVDYSNGGCESIVIFNKVSAVSTQRKNRDRRKSTQRKSTTGKKSLKVFFLDFQCPRTLVVRVTTSKLTLAKSALRRSVCVAAAAADFFFASRDFSFHHQIKADENYITKRGKITVCKDTGSSNV